MHGAVFAGWSRECFVVDTLWDPGQVCHGWLAWGHTEECAQAGLCLGAKLLSE